MAQTKQYSVGGQEYTGLVYGPGTKALLDTLFNGLIPCTVIDVLQPGNGRLIGKDEVLIRIDKTVAAYKAGEVLKESAVGVPPRKQFRLRGHRYKVDVNYIYERTADEEAEVRVADSS